MNNNIGIYKLISLCGEGASGKVFVAENRLTGARYALKIVAGGVFGEAELAALMRFRACRCESLVEILHVDRTEDGRLYYTMPLADDLTPEDAFTPDTLGNRIRRRGALPEAEIKRLAEPIGRALHALHGNDLLHRDVKPDNVLFINGKPVLGDIGLLTATAEADTAGTRGFFRPGALKRSWQTSDDFYALLVTLYCALTGFSPQEFPKVPEKCPPTLARLLRISGKEAITLDDVASLWAAPPKRHVTAWLIAAAVVLLIFALVWGMWHRAAVPAPVKDTVAAERKPVAPEKPEPPASQPTPDEPFVADTRIIRRTAGAVVFQSHREMAGRIADGNLRDNDLNFFAEVSLPSGVARSGKRPGAQLLHRAEIVGLFAGATDLTDAERAALKDLYLADAWNVDSPLYPLLQTECEIRLTAVDCLKGQGDLEKLRILMAQREKLLMALRQQKR